MCNMRFVKAMKHATPQSEFAGGRDESRRIAERGERIVKRARSPARL